MLVNALSQVSNVNLKLIQTFVLVAEQSSFNKAAVLAGRSQSAVSLQIKQLEQQMGCLLFRRTTRSVDLTTDGRELLESARRAMAELRSGFEAIRDRHEMEVEHIPIGCAPTISACYMPQIIRRFQSIYPNIQVQIQELKSEDIADQVSSGACYIGFSPHVSREDLAFDHVMDERIIAVVSPEFDVPTNDGTILFKDLIELPMVFFPENTMTAKLAQRAAAQIGKTIEVRHRCLQSDTLLAMADEGLGATMVTESIARARKPARARCLLILEPRMMNRYGLITHKSRVQSPASLRLIRIIKESLGYLKLRD